MSRFNITLRMRFLLAIAVACAIVLGAALYGFSLLGDINGRLLDALQQELSHTERGELLRAARHESWAARQFAFTGAVLAVLVGALLVAGVVGALVNHLSGMRRAMARVGDGDLDQRIELPGDDELAQLGHGFNDMVQGLATAKRQLDAMGTRYRAITEAAADAIITTDNAGRILSWNGAAERLFGFSAAEAVGDSLDIILPENLRQTHSQYLQRYHDGTDSGRVVGAGPRELMARRRDGVEVPVEVSITEMRLDGERALVGVIRDIAERKAAAEEVAYLTQYDTLTRLPNRSLLRERLAEAMARATSAERLVGVLQLDLDHFKRVNDSLDHDMGDQLLVEVAARVGECVRPGDHLARMGGDAFCVVIEGMKHVLEASVLGERLIEVLDRPFVIAGHSIYVTASIGISIYPFDDESPETLLKNADAAMHRCKVDGGNQQAFYADNMNARNLERVKLTADLRVAVAEEQFELFYQPQVSLVDGRLVGAEALIRWHHPDLGMVPPGQFIGLLEETGMILPVGEWAIRSACRQNAQWHGAGYQDFRVAINLSVRQFRDQRLVGVLSDVLDETRMDPALLKAQITSSMPMGPRDCLELELTEGLLMDNTASSCETLKAFKEMGIKLSVDDFGTGYSSLSYLKQFPLDTLKIDQSFVRDIGRGRDSELIIQAIIDLAHNLQLKVIGEGVENRRQLEFLREKGCDEAQGFLVARPMPADEMTAWMDAWEPSRLSL